MDWERLTEDQIDELIVHAESEISAWRAQEMAAISEKRSRQTHHADGYRSIIDWVAARADVSHETARSLTWTSTRLVDAPEVEEQLARGEITLDRAEQLARLPERERSGHEGYDISQLRRLVAHHRRYTRRRERDTTSGYMHLQPSLDGTTVHYWGELTGLDSRIVEKAVDQRADEVLGTDTSLGVAERRALALVALCQDSLYETESPESGSPVEVAVVVDARVATQSNAETGVVVLSGPRLGPVALEGVACNAVVEVIGVTETGRALSLGRRTRTVPRKLRRHVLHRDMGCTVEGCTSRYRLETHHVVPWSHGGTTDVENLITLCWYHHHIAVHREGLKVQRIGPSRARLLRPS
jgi:hypothetical protein